MPSLDFTKAIDYDTRRGASKADLNTMQEGLEPAADRGLVIVQTTEPSVTGADAKFKRYVWIDTSAEPYVAKVYSPVLATWAPGAVGAGTIVEALIANGAVTRSKIAALAVDETKLDDMSVVNSKLGDGSVSENKIATNAVVSAHIKILNVTTDKIADLAVTTPKIGLLQVTLETLAINSVDASKILIDAVEEDKIKDLAVTNAKIADNTIDPNKLNVIAVTDRMFAVKKVGVNEVEWVAPLKKYSTGLITDWYDPTAANTGSVATHKTTPFLHGLTNAVGVAVMPDFAFAYLQVKANFGTHDYTFGDRIPLNNLAGESDDRFGGHSLMMSATNVDVTIFDNSFGNWHILKADGTRSTAYSGSTTALSVDFDLVIEAFVRHNA